MASAMETKKTTAENSNVSADSAERDVSIEMLPPEKPHAVEPQRRRRIHRVPPQLRRRAENRTECYDPTVVSIGPYHHGQLELRAAEEVKRRFLNRLTSGGDGKGTQLHDTILERIGEFRDFYANGCVDEFDDGELAEMLLLDASFMLALMEGLAGDGDVFLIWHQCLGIATLQFAFPDLMLLENQLPYPVLKLVVTLRRGEEGIGLVNSFADWFFSGDFKQNSAKSAAADPLHFLEACHRIIAADNSASKSDQTRSHLLSGLKFSHLDRDITTRTATDLKSKGIEIRPNQSSHSIRDIKFRSSSSFAAELLLPPRIVWTNTLSILSNLIAYEMSPDAVSEFEVLSYANLMKSLTESAEDAREMQEKGILINRFQNQQQMVEEIRGVDTFGMDNYDIFKEVKMEIEEHCRSRTKRWMADLIHTRFASPWTVIAMIAAILLLCLTFVQTYFAINPINNSMYCLLNACKKQKKGPLF